MKDNCPDSEGRTVIAATVGSAVWLLERKEPGPPRLRTGGSLPQSVKQDLFKPEEELTFINCKQSLTEKCTYGLVSSVPMALSALRGFASVGLLVNVLANFL